MYMLQLSKRLQSVADLVGECSTIADVGTDHGYIPVYLVAGGKAKKAIAMDINAGPLSRAETHILQYGLRKEIETRLSDGCRALKPKEADVIVIAGMGGALMRRILMQGEEIARAAKKLVLQPQSEVGAFREFLFTEGYQITEEDMVLEEDKYYPVIAAKSVKKKTDVSDTEEANTAVAGRDAKACWKEWNREDAAESRVTCKFGPLLLERRHPVLKQYLLRQQNQKQKILKNLQKNARQDVTRRTEELLEELKDIERALTYYDPDILC